MAEAQAAVKVALDEYAQKFPNRDEGWTVELTPWREARFGGMRRPFTMAQLAVGVMLLLVCVSVAVLMRARTVLGERSAVLASRAAPSRRRARRKPAARARRRCDRRRPRGAGHSRRSVTSPRP